MPERIYRRLLEPPKQSFFLFGPRGTGKSTWVRETFPGIQRIDLFDEAIYQSYLAIWPVDTFLDAIHSGKL